MRPHGHHHNHHASPNEKIISACRTKDKIDFISTPNANLHIQLPHRLNTLFTGLTKLRKHSSNASPIFNTIYPYASHSETSILMPHQIEIDFISTPNENGFTNTLSSEKLIIPILHQMKN